MTTDARAWCATTESAWLTPQELAAARYLAFAGSDEECQAAYDGLMRIREKRLDQWKSFQ